LLAPNACDRNEEQKARGDSACGGGERKLATERPPHFEETHFEETWDQLACVEEVVPKTVLHRVHKRHCGLAHEAALNGGSGGGRAGLDGHLKHNQVQTVAEGVCKEEVKAAIEDAVPDEAQAHNVRHKLQK
jgi:hypothetical protein